MSWLSTRIQGSDVPFADFAGTSTRALSETLRVIELPEITSIARMSEANTNLDMLQKVGAFALFEEASAAEQRMQHAHLRDGQPVGPFTLAITDVQESGVIYLPDDLTASKDSLLLFADMDGLRRVIAYGQFDDNSALVENVEVLPAPLCSEGPCITRGVGCGDGCRCNAYPIAVGLRGLRCEPA